MTNNPTVVKAFPDANVLSYERTFDDLTITLRLWDDSIATLVARGVKHHQDTGTWELDGVVRVETLDDGEHLGYALLDTEDVQTLKFSAKSLVFISGDGTEEVLWLQQASNADRAGPITRTASQPCASNSE